MSAVLRHFVDVLAEARQVRPGDLLVPEHGTVRRVTAVDHGTRTLITWAGFDRYVVDDLDPHDPVTLRRPAGTA